MGSLAKVDPTETLDRCDKIEKIQRFIDELNASMAELTHQLEEARDLLKKCSESPEEGLEPGMNFKDDVLAARTQLKQHVKTDRHFEFDLVLSLANCHEIFVCPFEVGNKKLADYLAAEQYMIIRVCAIPGKRELAPLVEDRRVKQKKYVPPARRVAINPEPPLRKMNILGKLVIGGAAECIFRLHRNKLCLNGKFSLKSFYVTANNKIKLCANVKSSVCKRTRDGMNLDYFTLHGVIVYVISLCPYGSPTPFDLKCLLDLLSSEDPAGKQIIIRYNVSLMDEIHKRNHFISMYDRLEQIQKKDSAKAAKVLQFIKAINTDWTARLHDNVFTCKVRERHGNDTSQILDAENAMHLLETWRHNLTHLHDTSTEINDEVEVDIMDSVAPGVINQLQEGMDSIQELELPHLIHTMRK